MQTDCADLPAGTIITSSLYMITWLCCAQNQWKHHETSRSLAMYVDFSWAMVKTCLKTHMTMQCCHNPHQQQILRNRSFRPLFIIFQCVQRSKPCFFLISISCSHETSFHGPYGCCNLAPLKLRYSNQLTLFRHFRPFFYRSNSVGFSLSLPLRLREIILESVEKSTFWGVL
jgi:hypothetical protein